MARNTAKPERLDGPHYVAIKQAVRLGYYSRPETCPLPDGTSSDVRRDLTAWGYATPAGCLTDRGFALGCRLNS